MNLNLEYGKFKETSKITSLMINISGHCFYLYIHKLYLVKNLLMQVNISVSLEKFYIGASL